MRYAGDFVPLAKPAGANYFSIGSPTSVYSEIERHVQGRPIQHLQRRSQKPHRPRKGSTGLGLLQLYRLSLLNL